MWLRIVSRPGPNLDLIAARRRRKSPARPGQHMSRAELAAAINRNLDQMKIDKPADLHVDNRFIAKIERGDISWPHELRRVALRRALHAATDGELGLQNPR